MKLNRIPAPRMGRTVRSPNYPFNLLQRTFGITPFFIAPVLPGETLKNLTFQARAVTDPIRNSITGWWLEYYFFYVKHRDLSISADLQTMMTDPATFAATNLGNIDDTTDNVDYFYQGATGHINWTSLCLQRVVEEYFRDEGEAWNNVMIDTDYPAAAVQGNSVLDSVVYKTAWDTLDPDLTVGGDDSVSGSEVRNLLAQWEYLRINGLTAQSYEEFLATYGVTQADTTELSQRPELIRFVRQWQYPSNTVNASTGVPASAVSWSVAERADKDRFFKEPGFILGVTVARPKVYLSNMRGTFTALMNNVYAWMPPVMEGDPAATHQEIASASGLISGATGAFRADFRDLLMYGEQFTNRDLSSVTNGTHLNFAALPTTALQKKYPASTEWKDVFTDSAGTAFYVRQDGIVTLRIASRVRDTTPTIGVQA